LGATAVLRAEATTTLGTTLGTSPTCTEVGTAASSVSSHDGCYKKS
jgi:hypothetical protein